MTRSAWIRGAGAGAFVAAGGVGAVVIWTNAIGADAAASHVGALPSAQAVWDALWSGGGGVIALCAAARMIALERARAAIVAAIATLLCLATIIGANLVFRSVFAHPFSAQGVLEWPAAIGPALGIAVAYASFGRWWDWAPWTIAAWLTAQQLQMGPRFSAWAQWDWAQVGLFGALTLCLLAHMLRGR